VRRFLARRLAHGAAVIFIAVSLSFLLLHIAPGDPFSATLASASIDPATLAQWRTAYGFDRPILEQYIRFLGQAAVGNFGPSIRYHQPVADVLAAAIPQTITLMGTALVLSFGFGVPLGSWQAAHRGTTTDRIAGTASLIVGSLPEFWLGLVLLLLFAARFPILPSHGAVDPMHDLFPLAERVIDRARHLVLPALTLALLSSASIARYQRATLLDVLPQDFVRTARAKGVGERHVLWKHALRNAVVPTIVLAGLSLPALIGGAVFVERIFSWPGMGSVAVEAFAGRDYQLVAGTTVAGAVLVVAGSIVADLLHAVADPRVRAR
jgi:peptide/nickel transport system permease protein